jgi:hypothetical protein
VAAPVGSRCAAEGGLLSETAALADIERQAGALEDRDRE